MTIRAQKASEIETFELKDVQFETNKSELTYITKLILNKFAEYIVSETRYTLYKLKVTQMMWEQLKTT